MVSVLCLSNDNMTITAVNIYPLGFKGQSLELVPLPFSHLQIEEGGAERSEALVK